MFLGKIAAKIITNSDEEGSPAGKKSGSSKLNIEDYLIKKMRQRENAEAMKRASTIKNLEKNFITNFETSNNHMLAQNLPEEPKPIKIVYFKHAKLINLPQRYGDRTPAPLTLEKEEDADLG